MPYINLGVKGGNSMIAGPEGDLNVSLTDAEGWPVTEISYPRDKDEYIYLRWNKELAAHDGRAISAFSIRDYDSIGVTYGTDGFITQDGDIAIPIEKIRKSWYAPINDDTLNVRVHSNRFPVIVHLESADDGATFLDSKVGDTFETTTGAVISGFGYAGSGRAITGYAVYASYYVGAGRKLVERELQMIYRNPQDPRQLGSDDPSLRFYLPPGNVDKFGGRNIWPGAYVHPPADGIPGIGDLSPSLRK